MCAICVCVLRAAEELFGLITSLPTCISFSPPSKPDSVSVRQREGGGSALVKEKAPQSSLPVCATGCFMSIISRKHSFFSFCFVLFIYD